MSKFLGFEEIWVDDDIISVGDDVICVDNSINIIGSICELAIGRVYRVMWIHNCGWGDVLGIIDNKGWYFGLNPCCFKLL